MADQTPNPSDYDHRGEMTTSGFVPTAPVTQHITNLIPGTSYSVRCAANYKYTQGDTKGNLLFFLDDQRSDHRIGDVSLDKVTQDPHYPHNDYPLSYGDFKFTATKSEHDLITVATAWTGSVTCTYFNVHIEVAW